MPPALIHGEVVYLYAFDVASEIITAKIDAILSTKPAPFEIRLDRNFPKDVPLYRPLAIEPPPLNAALAGQPVRSLVRVYEVGVVSITLRVAFQCESLLDLMPFHSARLDDGRALDVAARELCEQVCLELKDLMIGAAVMPSPEAYTVFCLTQLPGVDDVPQWLNSSRTTVAGLLSETPPDRLSESQVTDALRIMRSFEKTDSIVIDWDAALVIDLAGYVDDELYVLELANLQLEEFRVMDQTLDRYLNRAYDDLERRQWSLLGISLSRAALPSPLPGRSDEVGRRGDAHHQVFRRLVSGPRLFGSTRAVLP